MKNLEMIMYIIQGKMFPFFPIASELEYNNYNKVDLFDSIHKGDIRSVKEGIKSGISVDLRNDKDQTLLHYAIMYRQVEIAKFLIFSGANLYLSDNRGNLVIDLIKDRGLSSILPYSKKEDMVDSNRLDELEEMDYSIELSGNQNDNNI